MRFDSVAEASISPISGFVTPSSESSRDRPHVQSAAAQAVDQDHDVFLFVHRISRNVGSCFAAAAPLKKIGGVGAAVGQEYAGAAEVLRRGNRKKLAESTACRAIESCPTTMAAFWAGWPTRLLGPEPHPPFPEGVK